MPEQATQAATPNVLDTLAALFAAAPKTPVKLAYSLLSSELLTGASTVSRDTPDAPLPAPAHRPLLRPDHNWKAEGIPLELCEYLAYKTALAYQPAEIISHNLNTYCKGITHYAYFDSTVGEDRIPNVDTQGFGFLCEGKAFIIMRGTSSRADWEGNLTDVLTDNDIEVRKELIRLIPTHGDLDPLIGHLRPGRHLGFLIGWAAIRFQIESWLRTLPDHDDTPIVISGHSLGGALAFLGAFEFMRSSPPRPVVAVVTFGAPKAGNQSFCDQYDRLLGERTVRIEARGDKVPDVARRSGYVHVAKANEWEFVEQPLLSRSTFDHVIKETLEKAAKEEAERTRKAEQERANKSEKENAGKARRDTGTKAVASAGPLGENIAGTQPPKSENSGGMWIFGVIVGLFVAAFAAIFVTRVLASHSIQQRYALYLSTLSYQRMRQLRNGDVTAANKDLDAYLEFIRGTIPPAKDIPGELRKLYKELFEPIQELPVRLRPTDDLKTFLSDNSRFV